MELAPAFSLKDDQGQTQTLSAYKGKYVVLYFYPKDATPGCTKEACAFRDAWNKYDAVGAVVLGVSTDDVASHAKFKAEHALPFLLLSDTDGKVAAAYNVPVRFGFTSRQTVLIGPDARIVARFNEVDPAVHAEEVLAAIRQHKGG